MILVDTGPLVALFDVRDGDHVACRETLKALGMPLRTTVPVLTEAFHLLGPGERPAAALSEFVVSGGLGCWLLDDAALVRAFELMTRYADRPMDLADASLVVAAERLRATRIFTLDRGDFSAYRARLGRTYRAFTVVDPAG